MSISRAPVAAIVVALLLIWPLSECYGEGKYYKQSATIGGVKREYYIYAPASLKQGAKHPAIIAFHGFQADANGMRWLTGADKFADQHGFIVIYPNAISKSWNAGKGFGSANKKTDDLSFVSALTDIIVARHSVDKKRIYAMGFSNGAQVVALMVCRMSQKLAAAAMVAHTLNEPNCNPKHKMPMMLIHGAKDPSVPYGGGGKNQLASHKSTVDFFRKVNEIRSGGKTVFERKTIKCTSYKDSGKPEEVRACGAWDAGHSWPGGKELMVDKLGKVNKELMASDAIMKFFKQFVGPPGKRTSPQLVRVGRINAGGGQAKVASSNNKAKPQTVAKAAPSKPAQAPPKKPERAKIPLVHHQVQVGDKKRDYWVVVPKLKGKDPIMTMHLIFAPANMSLETMAYIFDAPARSMAYRTAFVFSKGNFSQKTAAQDLNFVARVVADVQKRYVPEPHGVYAIGYSQGARIVERIYCDDPVSVTAIATYSYAWTKRDCEPIYALPAMVVQSKQDKVFPFKPGSGSDRQGYTDTVNNLASHRGGLLTKVQTQRAADFRCNAWTELQGGSDLLTCSVDWGGNTIPGAPKVFAKELGAVMPKLNTVQTTMDFLATFDHDRFSYGFHRTVPTDPAVADSESGY